MTKFFVEVRTGLRRTAGKYVKVIVVESNVGEDDEWSNDSAVFTGSDVASRQWREQWGRGCKGGLEDVDILQDEDETSILCSAVAFDQDSEKEKIAATINNSDTREVTHRDASSPLITEDGVDDLISEDGGINLMKMFNVYTVVMGDWNLK